MRDHCTRSCSQQAFAATIILTDMLDYTSKRRPLLQSATYCFADAGTHLHQEADPCELDVGRPEQSGTFGCASAGTQWHHEGEPVGGMAVGEETPAQSATYCFAAVGTHRHQWDGC